ncbi:MAG: tetratricopeptide repeat protein [Pseudomonadota bacterium]|nr:tetratricopeptide repeat protein [Pseudomonadota bacterium]
MNNPKPIRLHSATGVPSRSTLTPVLPWAHIGMRHSSAIRSLMYHDGQGNLLTTSSPVAAAYFSEAISDFLDYRTTPSARLKDALAEDPDFALASCLRAYFLMMTENRAVLPRVLDTIKTLLSQSERLTERERLHINALSAWADLDILKSCQVWEQILTIAPRDILALKLHHTMAFYTGRSQVLRSVIAGVLQAWNAALPGYPAVQGMYAYALEECGLYEQAERSGRDAVAANPDDLWAIHAVGHVLDMQGRYDEGIIWLNPSAEDWSDRNPFKAHLWWHAALFHLGLDEIDAALTVHDNLLCSVNTKSYVDVSNQASLLKRIEIRGIDVGERWELLAEHAATRLNDHILTFRDAHFFLALAAAGRYDIAADHIASMTIFSERNESWTAVATRSTLIPLCKGLIAYETCDYGLACDILWPMRNDLAPVGGSHTQRDLFRQILEDAAIKAGRSAIASFLLSERISQRPNESRYQSQYRALTGTQ